MRRFLSFLLLFMLIPAVPAAADPATAAVPAAQQPAREVASYQMAVTLDAEARQLRGTQVITYRNTTDVPIPDLVLHLYLNAFRSADTVFMQETGLVHRGFAFDPDETGWIEVEALGIVDGPELELELLEDGTLARAALPEPIAPGDAIQLETRFTARLPRVFARTGWALDAAGDPFFLVGQWFPKLGVWQADGWNAYVFHGNAEFFADFGTYEVTITVPEGYVTGATGTPLGPPRASPSGAQTITYRAENVIDFAWTASPNLRSQSRRVQAAGTDTEIVYLYLPEHAWSVEAALDAAALALERFSAWFGPYPYPRLTVSDVPEAGAGAGGMEYPTFVTAGAAGDALNDQSRYMLDFLIVHEVGHQWFQSLIATNEAEEPWLDEGITDYAAARLMIEKYGVDAKRFTDGRYGNPYLDIRRAGFLAVPDVPMVGPAWEFAGRTYGAAVYAKPALSLLTLESVLGADTMLEILATYTQRWAFAHPTTADFRAVAEEVAAQNLDWFFDGLVYGSQTVNFVAAQIEPYAITVARQGELAVPAPVQVTFADGSTQEVQFSGDQDQQTFTFAGNAEVQSFTIDPQHQIYIELAWDDNTLRREVGSQPAPPAEDVEPPGQEEDEPQPNSTPETVPDPDVFLARPPADSARGVSDYAFDVSLDVDARQVRGAGQVTYRNTSAAPMPDLVFHLYMNAFATADTLFLRTGGPAFRGFRWDPEHPGWITLEALRLADGTPLELELLEDGTLARAALPQPVAPGETVAFEMEFTTQLPAIFARTGWALDAAGDPFFMVGQWFPKLGVWTDAGWNAYPYHSNQEYFANFGRYSVQISVPAGYTVAATGLPEGAPQAGQDGQQVARFTAEDVIDFAWAASPNFRSAERSVDGVDLVYFYLPEHAWTVERVLDAAQAAVQHFGAWYGSYPYPRLSLLDVPDAGAGAGGMEYPTLVTVGTADLTGLGTLTNWTGRERTLEHVTVHEIGHQWWQSVVAFNEAEEPWLDEGLTEYSAIRLMQTLYGDANLLDLPGLRLGMLDMRLLEFYARPDVPMFTPAYDLDMLTYGIAAYSKPAVSLLTLERVLGERAMLQILSSFYQRYAFAHPTSYDLQVVAQQAVGGQDLSWFFDGLVFGDGTLNWVAAGLEGDTITIRREGDLFIPTEVAVTLANGATQRLALQPDLREQTFTFDQPVTAYTIDPDGDLLVELARADNGLRRSPDWGSWLAAFARLIYRLQDGLLALGGL